MPKNASRPWPSRRVTSAVAATAQGVIRAVRRRSSGVKPAVRERNTGVPQKGIRKRHESDEELQEQREVTFEHGGPMRQRTDAGPLCPRGCVTTMLLPIPRGVKAMTG